MTKSPPPFFPSLMASCCYKMMENPTFGREKELRERIVHLLGTIVKKYNQALGMHTDRASGQ